jgi:hypothetical protein
MIPEDRSVTSSILRGSDTADNGLLDAALSYAHRGWSIIAVAGKRAVGRWKPFQQRPADDATLRRLFARPGVTGLAVVTGKVSCGLAVRDFDREDAYHAWATCHPDDAGWLPTVRTARGYHVYGRLDAEQYRTLGDGELRADSRHYVLAPPSIHPDGGDYVWTIPLRDAALPVLPHTLTLSTSVPDLRWSLTPSTHKDTQPLIAWWTSAVVATLPTGQGQRNRCIFDLARRLKAIRPEATPAELRPVLREWHRLALPNIRTKEFSETWADFSVAWQRVVRPAGQSFRAAAAAADITELPTVVSKLGYDGHLARLTALCWQLADQWGHKPFPLGCQIAGHHLGVSARHAGRLLKALQFDGVLVLVSKGTKQTRKASEWHFCDRRDP